MESPSIPNKRSRKGSATSATNDSEDVRPDYNSPEFMDWMESRGYHMREREPGPDQDDVAFCQRLLQHKAQQVPSNTMFEDPKFFHNMLLNQSETHILCSLHFLLMPRSEELFSGGRRHLEHVADTLNDSWMKTEPIVKSRPQPDHSRCLRLSAFNEEEQQKLRSRQFGTFSYAVRGELYFPYLTCEIKNDASGLRIARCQNLHNMSIVARSIVQLAQFAGKPERVHRRVLGFSISHDLDNVQIHIYYPEIEAGRTEYFQRQITNFGIWEPESCWKCYSFVEILDAEFLPRHVALIKELLAGIEPPAFKVPPVVSRSGQLTPSASGQQASSYAGSNNNQNLEIIMNKMRDDLVGELEQSRKEAKEREEAAKKEAKEKEEAAREEAKAMREEIQALRRENNHNIEYYQNLVQQLMDRLPK